MTCTQCPKPSCRAGDHLIGRLGSSSRQSRHRDGCTVNDERKANRRCAHSRRSLQSHSSKQRVTAWRVRSVHSSSGRHFSLERNLNRYYTSGCGQSLARASFRLSRTATHFGRSRELSVCNAISTTDCRMRATHAEKSETIDAGRKQRGATATEGLDAAQLHCRQLRCYAE